MLSATDLFMERTVTSVDAEYRSYGKPAVQDQPNFLDNQLYFSLPLLIIRQTLKHLTSVG